MIAIANLLFSFFLGFTSPATNGPTVSATTPKPPTCVCQDIGHKSW